jgi:MSHA pilin protein MshC
MRFRKSPLCFLVDRECNSKCHNVTRSRRAATGFSLTELVTVIVLTSILAAIVAPRFVGTDTFASRGFSDEAIGIVRYAQKTAIAWRQQIFVCVTPTNIAAATAAGCATPIAHPVTGGSLAVNTPSGVSLPTITFRFDGTGRLLDSSGAPSATITIPITSTVPGDPARQIVVETETGYVH